MIISGDNIILLCLGHTGGDDTTNDSSKEAEGEPANLKAGAASGAGEDLLISLSQQGGSSFQWRTFSNS